MISLLDSTSIAIITAALGTGGAVIVTAYVGARHIMERQRLPAAVRDRELLTRVGANEALLSELEYKLRESQLKLDERDQAEIEAEHWQTLVETQKVEYANLETQRQEIEEVQEQFRQGVESLSVQETELRKASGDVKETREELGQLQDEKQKAEARLDEIENKEQQISELQVRLENLQEDKVQLSGEVESQRLFVSSLKTEEETRAREVSRLNEQEDRLNESLSDITQALEDAEPQNLEIKELHETCKDLKRQRESMSVDIDAQEAKARRLDAHIARLQEEAEIDVDTGDTDERILSDLRVAPTCLYDASNNKPIWPIKLDLENEWDALVRVKMLLKESGLIFPRRTINAFHTSLKTAVISPLTVLAGISGTGKSLLPRRYADAMGIHFLKIPVQPRWDGPQDLFGFYNYIEKHYKATDMARALVHMDSHNWPEEAAPYQDRMLMVLLDEMNLARVEYYFSEFLSRLEGRPLEANASDNQERAPSEITIDVSRNGMPKRVYPGQNILFVGTMNEDESTLALSDKVMDRANIMRFPRPSELRDEIPIPTENSFASGYLDKSRWLNRWVRQADSLDRSVRDKATDVIGEINGVMDALGRPFGHRMSQSMLHYVANYPSKQTQFLNSDAVNFGLSDQIEQRILPKLRGVDVNSDGQSLRNLAEIAGRTLGDQQLADAIEQAIDRSEKSIGIFNWSGFQRQGD